MENLGLSGLKDKEEVRSLAGSASPAANHGPLYASFTNFKARAERLVEEQDSVCTDTQVLHTKLRRAMELMNLFETKLEQALNEDGKLKLTDYEGSTPFQVLDSEISSSKILCDHLAETLQHLTSETGAEEMEKFLEEMLGKNYKALDVFNCMLHNLIIKADCGYQKNISGKLEETDNFHKEKLYAADVAIEKDPPIKQLGNSHEENAKSARPAVKFGSRGRLTGNYRRRVFLDCMTCESDTSEIYRICCDKVYCQLCATSCCEHSEDPIYNRNLSSTVPGATPFPDDLIVPEPYPPPPFPYYFHQATSFSNDVHEGKITHVFKNLHDIQQNSAEVRMIVHFYCFDDNGRQVHAGVLRTKPEEP